MQATTTRHQVIVDQAFTANGDTYRPGCIATIEPSAPLSAGDYIAAITPAGRLEVLHVHDNGAGLSYHTTTP